MALVHGAFLVATNRTADIQQLPAVTVAVKVVTVDQVPSPDAAEQKEAAAPIETKADEPAPSATPSVSGPQAAPLPTPEDATMPPETATSLTPVSPPKSQEIEPAPLQPPDPTPQPAEALTKTAEIPTPPVVAVPTQVGESLPKEAVPLVDPNFKTELKPAASPSPVPAPAKPQLLTQTKPQKPVSKPAAKPIAPPALARRSSTSSQAGAAGGKTAGRSSGAGMSAASYASLVLGQINAHKFYPPGAGGAKGQVVFSFTIGASGRVMSFSISRSSGNAALDRAASAAVHAIHAPPPPGGHFSAGSAIVFGR